MICIHIFLITFLERVWRLFSHPGKSSSSSCRAACADIPDRLSPFLPIIHRLRQVFRVASRVLTQLLYVGSCWSSHSCTSMCGGPQEYIAYELVLASPAVSCVSGSSKTITDADYADDLALLANTPNQAQGNSVKYWWLIRINLFTINQLFAHI